MQLSEFKNYLLAAETLHFSLPNGGEIPAHFHITEAGLISRHFIDCGGTRREEKSINFQIWTANDTEHRLAPSKLIKIIDLAADIWANEDLEVEMEYQSDTIGKYGLAIDGAGRLSLTNKYTNCLAQDQCGIPKKEEKPRVNLNDLILQNQSGNCCSPDGKCC